LGAAGGKGRAKKEDRIDGAKGLLLLTLTPAIPSSRSKQDALDYITWTYFFRRLMQNPTYYGLDGERLKVNVG